MTTNKMKKEEIKQPNVIIGYDDKGKIVSYYWQKEPINIRQGMSFTISRWLWWNPIWRLKQWWWSRKPMTFSEFKKIVK